MIKIFFALGNPLHALGGLFTFVVEGLAIVAALSALAFCALRIFTTTNLVASTISILGGAFSKWVRRGFADAYVMGWVLFAGGVSMWANICRKEHPFLPGCRTNHGSNSNDRLT